MLTLVLLALFAVLAAWLARTTRLARTEATARRTALIGLRHDLRGALAPAMLQAERLEAHGDAEIRRAAAAITAALERASLLIRETEPGKER